MWNKELYVREQQDAYEFFTSLVDQLDEHLKVKFTHPHHTTPHHTFFFLKHHLSTYNTLFVMMIFMMRLLSDRKWAESRSSKTHFRESSPTRRFVKTVLTGNFYSQTSTLLFYFETHHTWCLTFDLFITQVWAWRNIHGFEPWSNVLSKLGDLIGPVCERRGVGGQQRLLLWEMQGEGVYSALTAFILQYWYHAYLKNVFICTENHREEDVHQVPAQRSLYSPHALRLRLGERTLHQIWWTD